MRNPTYLAAGTTLLLVTLAGCGTTPPNPEQAAATAATRDANDLRYSNSWRIEVSEDVLVKKDRTEPRFALEVISSSVKSVRLRVQKE